MSEQNTNPRINTALSTTGTTRVCDVCNQEKPMRQFHNKKGRVCNSCYVKPTEVQENIRFVNRIQPALEAFESKMRQFLAHQRGNEIQVPHLMQLYQAASDRIGGAEAWAELWWRQLNMAILKNPGSKTVLDQIWKFAQFAQAALEMRESAPDVANMGEQELRTAILAELFVEFPEMFEALKAERPQIAVQLIDAGYDPQTGTVTPEDTRFDDDSADDDMSDLQFDDDDEDEKEFITPVQQREVE